MYTLRPGKDAMFELNPNGESVADQGSGFGGSGDPRLLGNHPVGLGARLLSASGAEHFVL